MHVQTIEASNWWARPRGETSANWIANYQNSLQSRHRTAIVQALKTIQPATLLEVGCHCGPNLVRLAQEFPTLDMIGIDASAEAIAAGRGWVARKGFADRVQMNVGRAPAQTQALPSGAFDVVLSCYTLAYIAPQDLDAVLYDLGRLAAKAVILAEPMTEDDRAAWHGSPAGYQEWAHNYRGASRWLNTWRGMTLRIVEVTPPVDRLKGILVATRDGAHTR